MSGLTPEIAEKVWQLSDADGDGGLTWQEFHAGLNKHRATLGAPPVPGECVKCWFSGIDTNQDGKVSKAEYIDQLLQRGSREDGLRKAFEKTAGKDGKVDKEEFKQLVVRLKFCKEDEMDFFADYIFSHSDKNNDGVLTFDEFLAASNKF